MRRAGVRPPRKAVIRHIAQKAIAPDRRFCGQNLVKTKSVKYGPAPARYESIERHH
jgi:hypothetical protein